MKYIALFISFIIFILTLSQGVMAQDRNLPGINCGIASDVTKNACCYNDSEAPDIPFFPDSAGSILPWPFDKIIEFKNKISDFKSKYADKAPCIEGEPTESDPSSNSCTCTFQFQEKPIPKVAQMCEEYYQVGRGASDEEKSRMKEQRESCVTCANKGHFSSALGCIPLNLSGLVTDYFLRFGIGIAGFVALICIMYSAIKLQTSRGDAEAIQKARENLTSCIIGLLLIIFSVVILRLIGIDILGLPGLE